MRVSNLILAGLLGGLGPISVQAEPITLSGSGALYYFMSEEIREVLGVTPAVGDLVTFKLTLDAGSPIANVYNTDAYYQFGLGSFSVTIGGETTTFPASMSGYIFNDYAFPRPENRYDQLTVVALIYPPRRPLWGIRLTGASGEGNPLSSLAWPTDVAAVLNASTSRSLSVVMDFPDEPVSSIAEVAPLGRVTQTPEAAPVPEPTTILLLSTGLAGVVMRRSRRQRQH